MECEINGANATEFYSGTVRTVLKILMLPTPSFEEGKQWNLMSNLCKKPHIKTTKCKAKCSNVTMIMVLVYVFVSM